MSAEWRERKRPLCLEQRYEFGSYAELRDFLDEAAELSERESLYPDMGLGPTTSMSPSIRMTAARH